MKETIFHPKAQKRSRQTGSETPTGDFLSKSPDIILQIPTNRTCLSVNQILTKKKMAQCVHCVVRFLFLKNYCCVVWLFALSCSKLPFLVLVLLNNKNTLIPILVPEVGSYRCQCQDPSCDSLLSSLPNCDTNIGCIWMYMAIFLIICLYCNQTECLYKHIGE